MFLFHSVFWRFSLKICNLGMATGRARKRLELGHSSSGKLGLCGPETAYGLHVRPGLLAKVVVLPAQIHKEAQRTPSPHGRSTKVLVGILKTSTMTKMNE